MKKQLLTLMGIFVLLVAAPGVAVGFWAIMTQLLGLYLAPGEVFGSLTG